MELTLELSFLFYCGIFCLAYAIPSILDSLVGSPTGYPIPLTFGMAFLIGCGISCILYGLILMAYSSVTSPRVSEILSEHADIAEQAVTSEKFSKSIAMDQIRLGTSRRYVQDNITTDKVLHVQFNRIPTRINEYGIDFDIWYSCSKFIPSTSGSQIGGAICLIKVTIKKHVYDIRSNTKYAAEALKHIQIEDDAIFTRLIAELVCIVRQVGTPAEIRKVELLAENFGDYANDFGIIHQLKSIKDNPK